MDHQTNQIMTHLQTTLVVHAGGIGDFLLCCPALLKLSSSGPLELLGNPDRLRLGVAAGVAQAVHDINHVGFESVFNEPNDRFRQFIKPFKRAIIWMRDESGLIQEGFQQCGLTNIKVFPGLPPSEWEGHASTYYLRCLGFSETSPLQLRVEPGPLIHDVIIHPGSGGKSKNWPFDYYLALAKRLRKNNRLVTWCLGPAEDDFPLFSDERSIRIESLLELARVLGSARLYIGNDSGITHLAAAVGCRTIAIFGPTNPQKWAPLGSQVNVLKRNPWPEPGEVMDVIRSLTPPHFN
jgi:heptosyltransferase-3